MAISAEATAVALGLVSAAAWGAGDFSGGLASRRSHVYSVVIAAHSIGLVLLVSLALAHGEVLPPAGEFLWACVAGVFTAVGLTALYRALAIGQMGIVAPITGVLSAGLPAIFSALVSGFPAPVELVGFVLAIIGIWLIARSQGEGNRREGIGLALISGIGFGGFLILISRLTGTQAFWPLAIARASSLVLMIALAAITRHALLPQVKRLPLALLSGILDISANVFFVLAAQSGRLDIAAVVASLYPASTLMLARVFLKERLTRAQSAGIIAVLAAIPLIAWR